MTDTSAARPERPPRPRIIDIGAGLLALSAVTVILAAASLFAEKDWLIANIRKADAKAKVADPTDFPAYVHKIAVSQTVVAVILAVLVVGIAFMARSGRPFARWAAILLYVLSFLTGTLLSYTSIISVAASEPLLFKIPSFLAATSFLAGVIVLNLKPSVEWLNWGRPVPAARTTTRGTTRAGGGLFAPRPTAGAGSTSGRPGGLFGRLFQPPADPKTVDVDPVKVETEGEYDDGYGVEAPETPSAARPGKAKGAGTRSTAKSRRS